MFEKPALSLQTTAAATPFALGVLVLGLDVLFHMHVADVFIVKALSVSQ